MYDPEVIMNSQAEAAAQIHWSILILTILGVSVSCQHCVLNTAAVCSVVKWFCYVFEQRTQTVEWLLLYEIHYYMRYSESEKCDKDFHKVSQDIKVKFTDESYWSCCLCWVLLHHSYMKEDEIVLWLLFYSIISENVNENQIIFCLRHSCEVECV